MQKKILENKNKLLKIPCIYILVLLQSFTHDLIKSSFLKTHFEEIFLKLSTKMSICDALLKTLISNLVCSTCFWNNLNQICSVTRLESQIISKSLGVCTPKGLWFSCSKNFKNYSSFQTCDFERT
jgi:hypothetical protein